MPDGSIFELIRLGGFAAAVAAAVGLQRIRPHARERGSLAVNVPMWLLDTLAVAAVCGQCGFVVADWADGARFGLLHLAALPWWIAVAVTVPALDLVSYVWHRANHRVRFLWRFHQVHHSDEHFTVSTAARFHPGEILMSVPVRLAGIALLGAPVVGVLVFELLFTAFNFVEHGDIDLPRRLEARLGRVLVLPALHRRHHSEVASELNSNFGTIFIVWDRLLATFTDSSSAARVRIGLADRPPAGRIADALKLPLGVYGGWR